MNKRRIKFILLWFFLIVSFAILATILILEANGYRLNRKTWKLEATGTIVLDGQPRQVNISVNGKALADSNLPKYLFKILPGQYDIVVSKDGYQSWSKTFHLVGGQASEAKRIILFLAEPKTIETTRKITLEDLQNDFQNQGKDLLIKENEIWYQEKLVTRFSQKPAGAILMPERNHIIFQLGSELRVMDLDATNNFKLVSLPNENATNFALYNNKLVLAAEDKILEAEIK